VTAPRPAADAQPPPSDAAGSLRRRWPLLLIGLLVLALAAAFLGMSYLFPEAPAPVGLAGATSSPAATVAASAEPGTSVDTAAGRPSAAASGGASSGGSAGGGLDGTWNVDPSIGSFSDFSGSFVGYRVEEELANVGAATAVGRTPDVTGSLTFAGSTVTAADFTADLSTLQSDRAQRDGQLHRQALETDTYPTATFKLTQPIDLGSVPAAGQLVTATATGDLTIHGVTKSVQIALEARLMGDVVTVAGSTEIAFADYRISRPRSFMVLSIADRGTMEFQLQLARG
jgi:polyisoprenoid-binding protein YceI